MDRIVIPPPAPRVWNLHHKPAAPSGAVYVGRGTAWGNPFIIGRHGTRPQVVRMHREWLCEQPELLARLPELRGKHLLCHCAPMLCHADTLMELANA